MPRSVTPESLRAEADALDAEIERLREEAADLRRLADRMEQRARGRESGLSLGTDYVTIDPMAQAQSVRYVKKNLHRGPVLRSRGPVASVARRLRLSMRQVAGEIGVKYDTLKAQDKRKSLTDDVRSKLDALVSRLSEEKPS